MSDNIRKQIFISKTMGHIFRILLLISICTSFTNSRVQNDEISLTIFYVLLVASIITTIYNIIIMAIIQNVETELFVIRNKFTALEKKLSDSIKES